MLKNSSHSALVHFHHTVNSFIQLGCLKMHLLDSGGSSHCPQFCGDTRWRSNGRQLSQVQNCSPIRKKVITVAAKMQCSASETKVKRNHTKKNNDKRVPGGLYDHKNIIHAF